MKKQGKDLEQLVATLERSLAKSGQAKVESPARLRDKRTGRLREHDVVLRLTVDHHPLTVALECRDRSRPVGVEQVEAFHQKCQDTGVDQGVLVSSRGFRQSAREKAAAYGIRCLDLTSAEKFDWLGSGAMPFVHTKIVSQHFTCIPEVNLAVKPAAFDILDTDGKEVTTAMLSHNVYLQVSAQNYGIRPAGIYPGNIRFLTPGYKIRAKTDGRLHDLKWILCQYEVKVEVSSVPIKLASYAEKGSGGLIAEAAVAPMASEAMPFDLVFTRKPGEGPEIKLVRRGEPKAAKSP